MFQFSRNRPATGTFVKTASPHVVEVLGIAGLDFLILDGEHAPFDRAGADLMALAARAAAIALLVRVPDHAPAAIGAMLDLGAAGVVVPHVDDAAQAAAAVAAARFTGGRRGFSPSPRFGGYGSMPRGEVIAAGDASLVVCQIESGEGVDNAAAIAAVPGVSALFIGRADLAQSLGVASGDHPEVMAAVRRICAACQERATPVLVALESAAGVPGFAALGVHGFVIGTDQSLLRHAAAALRPAVHAAFAEKEHMHAQ